MKTFPDKSIEKWGKVPETDCSYARKKYGLSSTSKNTMNRHLSWPAIYKPFCEIFAGCKQLGRIYTLQLLY